MPSMLAAVQAARRRSSPKHTRQSENVSNYSDHQQEQQHNRSMPVTSIREEYRSIRKSGIASSIPLEGGEHKLLEGEDENLTSSNKIVSSYKNQSSDREKTSGLTSTSFLLNIKGDAAPFDENIGRDGTKSGIETPFDEEEQFQHTLPEDMESAKLPASTFVALENLAPNSVLVDEGNGHMSSAPESDLPPQNSTPNRKTRPRRSPRFLRLARDRSPSNAASMAELIEPINEDAESSHSLPESAPSPKHSAMNNNANVQASLNTSTPLAESSSFSSQSFFAEEGCDSGNVSSPSRSSGSPSPNARARRRLRHAKRHTGRNLNTSGATASSFSPTSKNFDGTTSPIHGDEEEQENQFRKNDGTKVQQGYQINPEKNDLSVLAVAEMSAISNSSIGPPSSMTFPQAKHQLKSQGSRSPAFAVATSSGVAYATSTFRTTEKVAELSSKVTSIPQALSPSTNISPTKGTVNSEIYLCDRDDAVESPLGGAKLNTKSFDKGGDDIVRDEIDSLAKRYNRRDPSPILVPRTLSPPPHLSKKLAHAISPPRHNGSRISPIPHGAVALGVAKGIPGTVASPPPSSTNMQLNLHLSLPPPPPPPGPPPALKQRKSSRSKRGSKEKRSHSSRDQANGSESKSNNTQKAVAVAVQPQSTPPQDFFFTAFSSRVHDSDMFPNVRSTASSPLNPREREEDFDEERKMLGREKLAFDEERKMLGREKLAEERQRIEKEKREHRKKSQVESGTLGERSENYFSDDDDEEDNDINAIDANATGVLEGSEKDSSVLFADRNTKKGDDQGVEASVVGDPVKTSLPSLHPSLMLPVTAAIDIENGSSEDKFNLPLPATILQPRISQVSEEQIQDRSMQQSSSFHDNVSPSGPSNEENRETLYTNINKLFDGVQDEKNRELSNIKKVTDDTIAGSEHKNEQVDITEMKSTLSFEQIALQASRPEILERINAQQVEITLRIAQQKGIARQKEIARQADIARQSEIARKTEQIRAEIIRQADIARQAEKERRTEKKRQAENDRQTKIAEEKEIAQKAARARQKETARLEEVDRLKEITRLGEIARQEEIARRKEISRKEEIARLEKIVQEDSIPHKNADVKEKEIKLLVSLSDDSDDDDDDDDMDEEMLAKIGSLIDSLRSKHI
eukprot:CAMPEP_0194362068 /NCGR_PEP_ID=MMETSP0174-20130528/9747_1 /TAXON_ID=216777 /ORGANISM="Proboscia alata, Strain PI-D3" /LENGTH=1141 /DNA_ID=CAMNT_0039134669 /DNA_START=115 /DNA_END=3540 /DNA_ORIENTATION=+